MAKHNLINFYPRHGVAIYVVIIYSAESIFHYLLKKTTCETTGYRKPASEYPILMILQFIIQHLSGIRLASVLLLSVLLCNVIKEKTDNLWLVIRSPSEPFSSTLSKASFMSSTLIETYFIAVTVLVSLLHVQIFRL